MPPTRLVVLAVLFGAAVARSSEAAPAPDGGAAGGEEESLEEDLFKLDESINEMVVTAGGVAELRSIAAADVTVVSRDDIVRHGWRSLTEALANVPGLYVVDDLAVPSLGVRGITGGLNAGTRIVKVMINGVAVNFRPELTAFIGPELIPMEAVERIEVAKGPLSALYGANAFLAVVNVVTRTPAHGLAAEVAVRTEVERVEPGEGGSALIQYQGDKASFLGAISLDRIDRSGLGISQTFAAQNPALPLYAPDFGSLSRGDLSQPLSAFAQGILGKTDGSGSWTGQLGLQELDNSAEFQLNSVLTNQSRIALENFWSDLRYDKRWSSVVSTWARAGWSQGAPTHDYQIYLTSDNAAVFHPNDSYRALDAAAEIDLDPFPELTLRIGADFETDTESVLYYSETFLQTTGRFAAGTSQNIFPSTEPILHELHDIGAYLQATSAPFQRSLPNLHLTGNIRFDWPNLFPIQYSWRLAAAYQWSPGFTTKLIGGRAFQDPSGVLLFSEAGFGQAGTMFGNRVAPGVPPVTPQVMQSAELVAISRFLKHFSIEGSLYYQSLQNEIEFLQEASNFVARNVSASEQDNWGADVQARASFGDFSAYLSGSAQMTINPDPSIQIGNSPPLYPNYFGRLGADLDVPAIHLAFNVQLRAVGERGSSQVNTLANDLAPYTLPPYADVDLSVGLVGVRLLQGEAETKLRLAIYDLLDERHSEPGFGGFDVPNLGRVVRLELRQTF